jgi:hypothetical protein
MPRPEHSGSYFSRLVVRAWRETCEIVFGAPFKTFIIGTLAAALAIYLQRLFAGKSGFNGIEAFISLAYAVGANAVVFLFAFLFHFLYWSPKHLNEESAAKILATESQQKELARQSKAAAFQVACDLKFEGCVTDNIWRFATTKFPVRFWHLAVWTDSATINNCKAYLIRIEKEGEALFNGQEQLTFSPSEAADSLSKTLHNKVTSFVDIIVVRSDGPIHICTQGRQWFRQPTFERLVADLGKYLFMVAVTGDAVPTKTCKLMFERTGDWQTSFLTLVESD